MNADDAATTKSRRKTLMLGEDAHARIGELASRYDVTQPEVIDALLAAVPPHALEHAIEERVSQRRVRAAERRRKRELLEAAIGGLSASELENLLRRLAPHASLHSHEGE